ncbi:DUF4062 domain-containing protein [Vibrio owensii]|uniref:DUF4062 domain-containing protein n=1 Tax=Vibrio owensii TaxID=696485 RepID=UPI00148DCDC9|nr:DUF4062 domain-containing protein [Vibrio owensii]NOI73999.1 DUF4062 domain-containing protein [Vibrio owensii]
MEKKYQVFISSTYEDLKAERDQVIKAVLEMGHIPVGMEMFSAADEEQWKLISRQIEASDYYVVIVAHRYGSETSEGISFTEKEYDFASEIGVPTLGFVIDEEADWPASKVDKTQKKIKKLKSFKSKVQSKLVQFWKNKDELHGKASISLIKAMSLNPKTGWIRADEALSPDVTNELTRLSTENSTLRQKLERLERQKTEATDEIREVVNILDQNIRSYRIRRKLERDWDKAEPFSESLLDIFIWIAPNLLDENSSIEIANNIAFENIGNGYFRPHPIGTNRVSGIMADLSALDLVEPSKKPHAIDDNNTYWTLSKFGKKLMNRVRRIQLEEGIETLEQKSELDESPEN